MKIFIERENKTKEIQLEKELTIKSILNKLDIPIESVLLIKNNSICLEDELVSNEDEIKLLSVVSGG